MSGRSEINNPTARMGRVLDDYDALEYAYDELAALFAVHAPERFEQLPPKPQAVAVAEERVRRQLTLGKVGYKRDYMRLARARNETRVIRELTPEEEASIMDELSAEPTQSRT